MEILKCAMNERPMPKTFEEFKKICNERLPGTLLEKKLDRTRFSISQNWHLFIKPTIFAHMCNMSQFQWKRDFFQYVVDSKITSLQDINMTEAEKDFFSG